MKNLLKLGTPLNKEAQQQILGGNEIMYYCEPNSTPGCNCFTTQYYENGWKFKSVCQGGTS